MHLNINKLESIGITDRNRCQSIHLKFIKLTTISLKKNLNVEF